MYSRPSIMLRPKKAPSQKNRESVDEEYEKEKQRFASLQLRAQQTEAERLNAIKATPEHKLELQAKVRAEMEAHKKAKEEAKQKEILEERQFATRIENHLTSSQGMEQEYVQARKEYLRSLADENRRLIEDREVQKKLQREKELAADRLLLQNEFAGKFQSSLK